MASCG